MTALATSDDVETVLGRTLSAEESERVDAALDKASAFVRSETGRLFEKGSHTVRRRVRGGGQVKLDDATGVTAVVVVDCAGAALTVTGWTFRAPFIYSLSGFDWVEITYTSAGTVPEDLVGVVAALAARGVTASAPEGAESYTVTAGPYSESATFATSNESAAPTGSELQVIRRHALTRGGPVSSL